MSQVDVKEATIIKYIRKQQKHNKISNQQGFIAYKDSFMGGWQATQKLKHALLTVRQIACFIGPWQTASLLGPVRIFAVAAEFLSFTIGNG